MAAVLFIAITRGGVTGERNTKQLKVVGDRYTGSCWPVHWEALGGVRRILMGILDPNRRQIGTPTAAMWCLPIIYGPTLWIVMWLLATGSLGSLSTEILLSLRVKRDLWAYCSAYIALTYVSAIEVGKRSDDKWRAESLKRLENTLALFSA